LSYSNFEYLFRNRETAVVFIQLFASVFCLFRPFLFKQCCLQYASSRKVSLFLHSASTVHLAKKSSSELNCGCVQRFLRPDFGYRLDILRDRIYFIWIPR